jgi:hypothetical protein
MLLRDYLFGFLVFLALALRPLTGNESVSEGWQWAFFFLPVVTLLLARLKLSRWVLAAACCLVWAWVDEKFVLLPIFLTMAGIGAAAASERRRAAGLVAFAAVVSGFVMLPFPAQIAARQGLQALLSGDPAAAAFFGWSAPVFQDAPELAAALVLLLCSSLLSSPIGAGQIAENVASLFLLVLSPAGRPYLALRLAVQGQTAFLRGRDAAEPLMTAKFFTAMILSGVLVVAAQLGSTKPKHPEFAQITDNLDEYQQALESDGEHLRLFHELSFLPDLKAAGEENFLEPENGGAAEKMKTDVDPQRLHDALTLFGLREGWEKVLRQRQINAALLLRNTPLAGVLIAREKWRIAAESSPIQRTERGRTIDTQLMLLVPPGAP